MAFQARNHKPKKPRAYETIRGLANSLLNATRFTERRQIGNKLRDELSKNETRRQLAQEATRIGASEFSPAATRAKALQQLWTTVFTAAIGAAKKAIDKHSKSSSKTSTLEMDDIQLPGRLLVICGKADNEYDTSGLMIPYVSAKIVREFLELYKTMLDDNKSILSEPGSQVAILDMLDYLCSRPEHVGFFRYRRDFKMIFDRILGRLDEEVYINDRDVFVASSKVLDTLLRTCSEIGLQLEVYASEIIRLVANWCETVLSEPDKRDDTARAIPALFNAVASMISAHPDHSIGPMKRCGGFIYRYARKLYPRVTPSYKEALNQYFLAHMYDVFVSCREALVD
jgi:hypothetical protein